MPLVWRCTCGEDFDKGSMLWTSHVHDGRERGEEHKIIGLVDTDTGEIKATNPMQARKLGLIEKSTRHIQTEPVKEGKAKKTTIPTRVIAKTIDLDARLLILYDIAMTRFASQGYIATEGEWIWDCITKYYAEHAEDFGLDTMLVGMIKEGVA